MLRNYLLSLYLLISCIRFIENISHFKSYRGDSLRLRNTGKNLFLNFFLKNKNKEKMNYGLTAQIKPDL